MKEKAACLERLRDALSMSLLIALIWGCAEQNGLRGYPHSSQDRTPQMVTAPDTRESIGLTPPARREHRTVMLQHLESLEQIVAALSREDFEMAQGLTKNHLGFFMHRQAMARQRPEDFPPAYQDLAITHHSAAEELAGVMPTRDLKKILPKFDEVLKACVACHLAFKLRDEENVP